ncbi:hypothetical protein GCM10025867_12050 [Frondihabitans sucicola]|uniref:Uncharacterized protein n=1 Tax=Frondihabitans sucicola TaxID=1268041 RepID=A0ABN6XVH4_9MICO|nr:hypothetical protein [Frondihabitans sucicola]BDZ48964.1 hypothetical protein GCM10025867_12050 [Frondihabitans sucicola]
MNESPRLDPARATAMRAMLVDNARSRVRPRLRPGVIVFTSMATVAVVVAVGVGYGVTHGSTAPAPRGNVAVVPQPSATPDSTPGYVQGAGTPSPTPLAPTVADVDTVVFHAEWIDLLHDGTTVEKISMVDPTRAVAQMTELLGAPTTTHRDAEHCTVATSTDDWGDGAVLFFREDDPQTAEPAYSIRVLKASVTSTTGSTITLAATGVKVGDNIADEYAKAPDTWKYSFATTAGGTSSLLMLGRGWLDPAFPDVIRGSVSSPTTTW